MEHIRVESSNVKSVGYDPFEKVLEVRFHSGGLYRYADVPVEVHKEFLLAESAGGYFHKHIKGKYSFARVPETPGLPDVADVVSESGLGRILG